MSERLAFHGIEVREAPDGDGRTVVGVAVPFDEVGQGPRGPEVVKRGAFTRTLDHMRRAGKSLKVLRAHDAAHPVGVVVAAEESDSGLLVEVRMADTQAGEEALREVRAGMLDSFSIGFVAKRERSVGGVRQLLEVALQELSLVALPAYPGARVAEVRDEAKVDYAKYRIEPLRVDVEHL